MSEPSPRSIATRTGDEGTTSLLYGQRVAKDHPQIEAVGALDELNAAIGLVRAGRPAGEDSGVLMGIQNELVALMGEVACAEGDTARHAASKFSRLDETSLAKVDAAVAAIESRQPKFDGWATPGSNPHAAALDHARTVARRAERRLVNLVSHGRILRPVLLHYINRVSDLLWLMAREAEN